jgi:hypothetical protein
VNGTDFSSEYKDRPFDLFDVFSTIVANKFGVELIFSVIAVIFSDGAAMFSEPGVKNLNFKLVGKVPGELVCTIEVLQLC